jgi:arabinose-5-phosphate isomerase
MDQEKALDLAKQTLLQEINTIQALADNLDDTFWQVANLLSTCSGMIWITAVGTSAAVAARFAHLLTCCGIRSMFLSPSDGLHGHTGVIQPEDILIAMSRGGETIEVIQMAQIANDRSACTIAFVNNTDSSLTHTCRYILPIQSPHRYELMGYIATTSTVAYSAVCDALCAVVLDAKGYTPEEFAKTHPGGAVGQVLSSSSKQNKEHQE